MLEKPDVQDELIVARLREEYGLRAVQIAFLPLGADMNTAVYRVVGGDGTLYFLKLRSGVLYETSVALPRFLHDQGVGHIIAPLATRTGYLWASLEAFKLILYPFVDGRNGYEVAMSDRHWRELATVLKCIHSLSLPAALRSRLRQETYSSRWREIALAFLGWIEQDGFADPVATKLAVFLKAKHTAILDLVKRAERLGQALQARSPAFVLCHSDIHAGNVLIDADGAFYLVDWDDPILAPKERDLMFPGSGQGFLGHTAEEEESLFYQGYGPAMVDARALAYYRYERIVVDIAEFCRQIFLPGGGDHDREQSFRYLTSNFRPNGTIDVAYRSDRTRRERGLKAP
jgi:spectinomycin phosphotransferase